MNNPWVIALIGLVIGTLITVLFLISTRDRERETEKEDKEFQKRTEASFIELNKKLDTHIYQDGIPFTKNKEKRDFYDKALAAMKESDYKKAATMLEAYLNKFIIPDSERCAVLNLLGISVAKNGDYPISLKYFNEMSLISGRLKDRATKALALFNSGCTLGNLERFPEAIAAYNEAIDLNPNYWTALNNKGRALDELARYEEAINAYDNAILLKPDRPEIHENKGLALIKLSRYKDALNSFDKAIEINPKYSDALIDKSAVLGMLSRYEESLFASDQAIRIEPNHPDAWQNRALALANLGRLEESLIAINKSIIMRHTSSEAWNIKGNILTKLNRIEEALESFKKANELTPINPISSIHKNTIKEEK